LLKYCSHCQNTADVEAGATFCPHCGAFYDGPPSGADFQSGFTASSGNQQEASSAGAAKRYTPWENRARYGFAGGLYETWKESVFNPTKFYGRMPLKGGIGNPLLYGLILGLFGTVFSLLYQQFFSQLFDPSSWYPQIGSGFDREALEWSRQIESISFLFLALISPVFIALWLFIASGLLHLVLMIFGWKKEDFEATFRVVSYSEGASFFAVVPIIGGFVSVVWQLVLAAIGLKEVHQLTTGKAVFVVLAPLILCCLCCCGFFGMLAAFAGLGN